MFLLDAHVHIYQQHSPMLAVRSAIENLRALAPAGSDPQFGICLTESAGCNAFAELSAQASAPGSGLVLLQASARDLKVSLSGVGELFIFAGRQVATSEKLECLAFGTGIDVPNGLTFQQCAQQIRAAGAIPMLPWGLGKWMLKREKIVREIILQNRPTDLLICDSTVRPTLWPMPRLMKLAEQRGYKIVAGSDPFPLPGEEQLIGSYATALELTVDAGDATAQLLSYFASEQSVSRCGVRSPVNQAISRNLGLLKAAQR